MLTQQKVRDLIDYDPESGILTWKQRAREMFPSDWACTVWNKRFHGKAATARMANGYRQIRVLGNTYLAHRIIWLWMTGAWPAEQIDHLNHDRTDNRWSNLREVSNAENGRNRALSASNKSGYFGVNWDKSRSRWVARIGRKNLGRFEQKKDAIAARKAAEPEQGYHENHGRFFAGPRLG